MAGQVSSRPLYRLALAFLVCSAAATAMVRAEGAATNVPVRIEGATGQVTLTTDGFATRIVIRRDGAAPLVFQVQYENAPSTAFNVTTPARVLYSSDSIAVAPLHASSPSWVFTVAGKNAIVKVPGTQVEHISVVGLSRFGAEAAAVQDYGPIDGYCDADCMSGGDGSSGCSVNCGAGCSVTCKSGYTACCRCVPYTFCKCCKDS